MLGQRLGGLREAVARHPGLDQRTQLLARPEAVAFQVEVQAQAFAQRFHGLGQTRGFADGLPLLQGQADDDQALAVRRAEVAAEGAKQLVAVALPLVAELGFGDQAQVAHRREGHVFQRQLHMLALPGLEAVAFGREQTHGRHLAGDEVPGRQHVVHGFVRGRAALVAGDVGDADARVDGVVHRRTAVPVALHGELDQVFAPRLELVVVEPAARRKVGEQDARVLARRGDERHRELAALGPAQVDGHRTLGLVEAAPEQAHVVPGHGPALVIQPAAQGVEADHVGAHLRQRHAAQRRGDEGGGLNDPHAGEDGLHDLSASSSRLRPMTLSASVSSAPSKIESTRASTK